MSNIIDNCSHMSIGLRRILINGGDFAHHRGLAAQRMTGSVIAAKVFGLLNLSSCVGQTFRS